MKYNYKDLYSKQHIQFAVENMGKQITKDYTNKKLIVFTLADGGIIFAADLIRKIDMPVEFYTVVVKSYGVNETSNQPKILYFPENIDWTDKEVLIIDDVCDSGKSVEFLKNYIKEVSKNNDINIRYAVLVQNVRNVYNSEVTPDYVGFFSHGEWLVGYGMDDQLLYRNIDHVVYKERNVI